MSKMDQSRIKDTYHKYVNHMAKHDRMDMERTYKIRYRNKNFPFGAEYARLQKCRRLVMFRSAFSCRVCYTDYHRNNLAKGGRHENRNRVRTDIDPAVDP